MMQSRNTTQKNRWFRSLLMSAIIAVAFFTSNVDVKAQHLGGSFGSRYNFAAEFDRGSSLLGFIDFGKENKFFIRFSLGLVTYSETRTDSLGNGAIATISTQTLSPYGAAAFLLDRQLSDLFYFQIGSRFGCFFTSTGRENKVVPEASMPVGIALEAGSGWRFFGSVSPGMLIAESMEAKPYFLWGQLGLIYNLRH